MSTPCYILHVNIVYYVPKLCLTLSQTKIMFNTSHQFLRCYFSPFTSEYMQYMACHSFLISIKSPVICSLELCTIFCPSDQTKLSSPIKTSQNDAYSVTCPTRKNKAYEFVEEVHHYETIDGPKPVQPVYETVGEPSKKYVQCQSA